MVNVQVLKLMYFFSKDNIPKQLENFSQKSVPVDPYNTRNEEQLHIPKNKCGASFLRYHTPFIWNKFSRNNRNQNHIWIRLNYCVPLF